METNVIEFKNVDLIPLDSEGNPKYTNLSDFNALIMSSPRNSWVKTNPFANNSKYLPIRIVEELLTGIFPFWLQQLNQTLLLCS